jgi:hypothetical protein
MRIKTAYLALAALMALAIPASAADVVVPADTVIPLTLDKNLSSATGRVGDTFTAHHEGANGAGFPEQTKFVGRIESVKKATWNAPGQISVDFVSAELPSGESVVVSGRLTSLDQQSVNADPTTGRLVSTTKARKTNTKFIAYGAGAGLVLGELAGRRGFLGAVLGGAAGYLYGQKQGNAAVGKNVEVPAGTKFGVLLNQEVAFSDSAPVAVGGVTAADSGSGRQIRFNTLKPVMNGSELMLPFRYVMDSIEMPFDYDSTTKTISVDSEGSQALHTVGTKLVYMNGKAHGFATASRIMNGAIYVPAGYIELLTQKTVFWDQRSGVLILQ